MKLIPNFYLPISKLLDERQLDQLAAIINSGEHAFVQVAAKVGERWLVNIHTKSEAMWETIRQFGIQATGDSLDAPE